MATGVQELKLAARMHEWSGRIAECRSSGMSVRAWCKEQGIAIQTYYHWEKRFVTEATQQLSLPALFKFILIIVSGIGFQKLAVLPKLTEEESLFRIGK